MSPERCPAATENFNFPLEIIDNNANIFPCDGGSPPDKGFYTSLLPFHLCPYTDESDEDDNAS